MVVLENVKIEGIVTFVILREINVRIFLGSGEVEDMSLDTQFLSSVFSLHFPKEAVYIQNNDPLDHRNRCYIQVGKCHFHIIASTVHYCPEEICIRIVNVW